MRNAIFWVVTPCSSIEMYLLFRVQELTNQETRHKRALLKYCDVLDGNASNNLWVLDLMLGLLDIQQVEFTITYCSLGLTVIILR
jgi:hypothetical protein